MTNSKAVDNRSRTWAFIIYPESLPENWQELISQMSLPCLVSPLHDIDLNADLTPKKPHYHVLCKFVGKKSYNQVQAISESLGGTIPQTVMSFQSYARYLVHADNPEKAQYKPSDILNYGGLDYAEALKPLASQRYKLIMEMQSFCRENNVTEFCDLADFAAANRFDDWFPLLTDSSAFYMNSWLKSFRFNSVKKYDN